MNRSIEQALLSLLPTHNSNFPQPLTELAGSLLAQSRQHASTLRVEEEIAIPYACAHLACDRLKIALNLPPIEPRPPIPPRAYKRLYAHLDKILPAASATPSRRGTALDGLGGSRTRTPTSKLRDRPLAGSSPLADKARPTPGRAAASLSRFDATPSRKASPHPARQQQQQRGAGSDPLPRWIRPTVRFLAAALGPDRTDMGPVVASGLESIVAPRGRLTDDGWVLEHLAAVVGAVHLFVWRGVTWPGREVEPARYVRFRKQLAAALAKAREEVELKDDGDWEGWREVTGREIDTAALRGNRHGWFEMDWVAGVEDLVMRLERAEEDGEEEGATEEVFRVGKRDTMFQERYDYLSEKRMKEFTKWRERLVRRIRELEKEGEAR